VISSSCGKLGRVHFSSCLHFVARLFARVGGYPGSGGGIVVGHLARDASVGVGADQNLHNRFFGPVGDPRRRGSASQSFQGAGRDCKPHARLGWGDEMAPTDDDRRR